MSVGRAKKPITESWRDRIMRTAIRLLFFMILSCHDSVASSSVGRICGIPLTIIALTSLWPFPFSIVALVAAGRATTWRLLPRKLSGLTLKRGSSLFSVESKWLVHQIAANTRPAIPKGLNRSAQGWPILRGLPRVAAFGLHNPERGCFQINCKLLMSRYFLLKDGFLA